MKRFTRLWSINNTDFARNWLTLGKNGCLCFDYKVDWSSGDGSNAGSAPKFQIYTGPVITSVNTNGDATSLFNSIRAIFVGNNKAAKLLFLRKNNIRRRLI